MRTIYAEYNINHDSIDVYTSAGYMLRIDCWEAEKNLKTILDAKRFKLNVKINPEWKGVNHIISGGPYLIKNGDIYTQSGADNGKITYIRYGI